MILRELNERKTISFQEGNELLEDSNVKTKINALSRCINRFFNNKKIESPIVINYAKESLSLKDKYKVVQRTARIGRHPQTGEEIDIAARIVPKFVLGKALKDAVK